LIFIITVQQVAYCELRPTGPMWHLTSGPDGGNLVTRIIVIQFQ